VEVEGGQGWLVGGERKGRIYRSRRYTCRLTSRDNVICLM
jgi:hypothetical protein